MPYTKILQSCVFAALLCTTTANDGNNIDSPEVHSDEDVISFFVGQGYNSTVLDRFHRLITPFKEWKTLHGKSYGSVQNEVERITIWMNHDDFINEHNQKDPKPSYVLAHNFFSDIPNSEFRKMHSLGEYGPDFTSYLEKRRARMGTSQISTQLRGGKNEMDDIALEALPKKEVNWVEAGAVTPVKNQEQCGSCWSFSATGAIEGANFVTNGELVSLSEQILVDCDKVDKGCNGGLMDSAFEFDEANNGLCAEDDYPYVGHNDDCKSDQCTPVPGSAVQSYHDVPESSMHGLLLSIIKQPTSIAMQADQLVFQLYGGGVFDDTSCGQYGEIDHGVLAVGFGHDEDKDMNYILVKNSWGDSWGEEGYIRLKRHSKLEWGTCAILKVMSRPNVANTTKDDNAALNVMVA